MEVADGAIDVEVLVDAAHRAMTKTALNHTCPLIVIDALVQPLDAYELLWHFVSVDTFPSEHILACDRDDEGHLRHVGQVRAMHRQDVLDAATMVQLREPSSFLSLRNLFY